MSESLNNSKTVLITGAGGLLGERLSQGALKQGYRVWRHFHRQPSEIIKNSAFGDIGDKEHLNNLAARVKPEIIINCAALADVDRCEQEPDQSKKTNVDAVALLDDFFPDTKLVHISTDYVFPGKKAQPRPDDPTEPINIYGHHKLEAEKIILSSSRQNLVIRAILMFDNVDKRNFFRFVLHTLREGKPIEGIADQYTNPQSAPGAAQMILDLIEAEATGIWHIGGADYINRFELSCRIADFLKLDRNLIKPITSDQVIRKAARPKMAGLDISETEKFLGYTASHLEEELARIL